MTAPIAPSAFDSALALPGLPGLPATDALPPAPPSQLLPHELPGALTYFPQVRLLSLDCFDTLLWRDCHAPTDVFTELTHVNIQQRVLGEVKARRISSLAGRGNDVPIDEIYAQAMPNASRAERAEAIRAELEAEIRHCYAFVPTVELMRAAKAKGLTVIIVSDTYFDEKQLRELIARAAGEDVSRLIDRIFCSSHYRKPKAGGLYADVLRNLKRKPSEILHIGDNPGADVGGVVPFGVNALHLKQFHEEIEQQLRLESCISTMLHPQGTQAMTAPQPHRSAIAHWTPQLTDEARHFGYAVIGPVLTGFDRWLAGEAEALQQARGGQVHWLFLMRDGHLPMRVHRSRVGDDNHAPGHPVEISRFTATAASFVNDKAINAFMDTGQGTMPDVLARQLMLPETDIQRMCEGVSPLEGTRALQAFLKKPAVRRHIQKSAQTMANRLIAHVRKQANPQPGDTLMLVDLGYNGSVQNAIDSLLTKELQVHVAGRYLLLRETEMTGLDKAGYFGVEHYDLRALNAMSGNVAVLEQLCTTETGSTIAYTEAGDPVRKANDIKSHQSNVREAVQEGCLHFAESHCAHALRAQSPDQADLWRRANAATLARLMFLPMPYELRVFENFEHDVNLGTDETVALFDPAIAERGLRQQGMFYQKGVRRMYLPAELASQGLATSLTHFAASRFALPLTVSDFGGNGILLPVIYSDGREVVQTTFNARPTHDGYYALCVPISDCRYSVAVAFGEICEWVEVDSISAVPSAEYLENQHDSHTREVPLSAIFEDVDVVSDNLWHFPKPTGIALVNPPERKDDTKMLLVVVFRPVVRREVGASAAA